MNRTEFIKLIIEKRKIDGEIYQLSLKIDNFPIARKILNKIDGNINLEIILEASTIQEIKSAKENLISTLVYFLKDPLLKSETQKFLNDLVDEK